MNLELLSYFQSPAALVIAVAALVALVRRFVPRVDGPGLVLACAAACGAALAGVQATLPWIATFISAHPVIGTVLGGAVAGATAFGLHDVIAGWAVKAATLSIDARSSVGSTSAATFEVNVDAKQATAALDELKQKAEATTAAVLASTVIVPPPPKVPT